MNERNGKADPNDFVGKGFHRLDEKLIALRPPKILWGAQYLEWPDKRKVEYLEKLSATMNHAARLIQDERNQLNEVCAKKEKQIVSMQKALDANNEMIQGEITRMNEERQHYNKAIADLNAKVRALEHGSVN